MAEAAEQLPPPQYPSPLERERESASFIASEMAALLYTQRRIDAKRAVADILRADPVLAKLRSREPFLSKKERFADQLEKTLRFWQMAQEQGWMDEDGMVPSTAVPFARDYAFPPLDGVASNLSDGMFIGAIRGQMSPEQQAKWLPLAQSHQILGTCKCSRSLCVFFGRSSKQRLHRRPDRDGPRLQRPRARDDRHLRPCDG